MPIHIHPTAAMAPRALLPGDPGRALALAQELLGDDRKMFNHNRGLWGYTGTAADGSPLTIQSTGLGGPSASIVLEELVELGLEVAVRVGTCGAISDPQLGELVTATETLGFDGASRALGAPERQALDPVLTAALAARSASSGTIVTCDLFYDPLISERIAEWRSRGAVAIEMEAAALAAVADRHGIRFACLLGVSDVLDSGRERIGADALAELGLALGRTAFNALIDTNSTST